MVAEPHPGSSTAPSQRSPDLHPPEKSLARRFVAGFRHEFRKMLVVSVFFFACFTLLKFTQMAILHRFSGEIFHPIQTIIASLIIGKVVLLADAFRFVARLDRRPLIVAALLKSGIYLGMTFLIHYLEFLFDHRPLGLAEASRQYRGVLSDPVFWMLQVWLFILLVVFTLARDTAARIGRERFVKFLFGQTEGSPDPAAERSS
jgi:hypothetical protein